MIQSLTIKPQHEYVCPDGFPLGLWLSKTRVRYAKGKLSSDVIEHLNEMHFMWERPKKKRSGRKSMALADYISENGYALGK